MGNLFSSIKSRITSGDARSVRAKKNIIASFLNKIIAIVISLLIIPITIDYLDAEQYGIWLTLSSIVSWISFFDIGLGHGFRNRFAEAKAKGDIQLAKKYVSTTYFSMILIFGLVLVVFEVVNPFINWASLLNIDQSQKEMLSFVMSIILIGVCTSFATNVFSIMLSADQKPALSSIIATIGQAAALALIYALTLLPKHSMVYIAFALTWVPVIITVVISVFMFIKAYRDVSPSFKYIDTSLIKNIINLGVKFFFIQISMILIFQVVNIVFSRVLGPTSVTQYNIAYKYFSISQMCMNIITAPYWSAFTEAYTKGETVWMKNVQKKLLAVFCILFVVNILLLVISHWAYGLWIGDKVSISFIVSASVMSYISAISFAQMYMILLNGIGKIKLQMLIYVLFAIICIPSTNYLCSCWGIPGVMAFFTLIYVVQGVLAKIQLSKLLDGTATGIWNK